MKIKKAPLLLKGFYVLSTDYKLIDSNDTKIDSVNVFEDYSIDFDFKTLKNKNDEQLLFVKITVNDVEKSKLLPGYVIKVEAVSVFDFCKTKKLSVKQQRDFIYMSGLSISINNLRAYIENITSYGPFGKFQLPAIDIAALHKAKSDLSEKKKKKN